MKYSVAIIVLISFLASCKMDAPDPDRFKTGLFEIPGGKGYEKTIIVRTDSIQIEKYKQKVDTLSIQWTSNFSYTLKMLHPKTDIDLEPIHIKITSLNKNSYDFEAVIGHSNFVQNGTLIKIKDE